MRVGFLVAGFKGFNFLINIHLDCQVAFVASYETRGTLCNSFKDIQFICSEHGYKFLKRNELASEVLTSADIILVAGWQYLIDPIDERFVVLHDSLLPRFRGFSPTVTALILGERELGVTALKPKTKSIDTGSIYEQKSLKIEYPIKIKDAYLLLADVYAQVARAVLDGIVNGSLVASEQDESKATYSIWRDEEDYYIDWNWSAEKLSRFVNAVGYPYCSARSIYRDQSIHINQVSIVNDRQFEDRHPGKIWRLNNGLPEVICGEGMIQILSATKQDGSPVIFDRMRERLARRPLYERYS